MKPVGERVKAALAFFGKNRAVTATVVLAVLLAGLAGVYIFLDIPRDDSDVFKLPVFYFNANTGRLEPETHSLLPGQDWLNMTWSFLAETPRTPALSGIWPEGSGLLLSWQLNGNVLEVVFSSAYHDIPPMEEALFRSSLVWTMTGLPFVDHVLINLYDTEAEPLALESRRTVVINPAVSPVRQTTRTFTLYYVSEDHDRLAAEQRTSNTVDMDQIERYIVTQLIEGPENDGLVGSIPPETRVLEVRIEDYTCYVNLSADFISRFNSGASLARLMVYSIVNSLTDRENYSHVRRVQFLIDSERVENFHGVADFNQAFERDESFFLGYEAEAEDIE
jgi:germination protein M